jgi:hypothetical protein
LASLLSFRRGPTPPQCPVTFSFRKPLEMPTARFTTSSNSRVCRRASYVFWLPRRGSCLLLSSNAVTSCPARSLANTSIAQCRNGMEGQPSSASGQLLSGPTIALRPFLRPSAAPDAGPPLFRQCPLQSRHYGLLILRYRLHIFWICFHICLDRHSTLHSPLERFNFFFSKNLKASRYWPLSWLSALPSFRPACSVSIVWRCNDPMSSAQLFTESDPF